MCGILTRAINTATRTAAVSQTDAKTASQFQTTPAGRERASTETITMTHRRRRRRMRRSEKTDSEIILTRTKAAQGKRVDADTARQQRDGPRDRAFTTPPIQTSTSLWKITIADI